MEEGYGGDVERHGGDVERHGGGVERATVMVLRDGDGVVFPPATP